MTCLRIKVRKIQQDEWELSYPDHPQVASRGVTLVSGQGAYLLLSVKGEGIDPTLADLTTRVAAKQPRGTDVEAFGRYLFQLLIGTDIWNGLAPNLPGEIVLSCRDHDFGRLPWEMMHGPSDFLAADGIALVRTADDLHSLADECAIRPKVLFVIGAELESTTIRAGAEFFGLIRRLQTSGLAMELQVLTRATRTRMEDAIEQFRPSIVHVICHGGFDPEKGGYLELAPEDKGQSVDKVFSSQLVSLLHGIPSVVVLNACKTGRASPDTASLALEVLTSGIPIVIGMSGKVADRVCRLFTRRFYEALLQGEPLAEATAAARKMGMSHGYDPRRSVDWAMPVLFIQNEVKAKIDKASADILAKRARRAEKYRVMKDPVLVCGRTDCLQHYQSLLDHTDRPQVLVLKVGERSSRVEDAKYGKTRLLGEMAALAALRGFVPCLVEVPANGSAPKSFWQLAIEILKATRVTREHFDLPAPAAYELKKLEKLTTGHANELQLSAAVRNELMLEEPSPGTPPETFPTRLVRAALAEDLLALAAEAKESTDQANLRIVVLIDDIHLYGEAGKSLVQEGLSAYGLGTKGHPIPVVLSYSAVAHEIYKADVEAIKSFVEQRQGVFFSADLKPFRHPSEDELPYQYLLLAQQPMLVFGPDITDEERSDVLQLLYEETHGVPSRFRASTAEVYATVRAIKKFKKVSEANDDDVLAELLGKAP